jgi:hypothetical protein
MNTFMQAAVKSWDDVGKVSSEAAKGVEIIKKLNRWMGRLDQSFKGSTFEWYNPL